MRLIDVDKLKKFYSQYDDERYFEVETILQQLDAFPTAPEKTGTWSFVYDETADAFMRDRYVCSCCGGWNTYGQSKYCPECGAKMTRNEHIYDEYRKSLIK